MINMTSTAQDELKEQFDRDGYCVVPGLFSEPEIQEIEDFFEEFRLRPGNFYDGGAAYKDIDPKKAQLRVMHPHRYDDRAKEWFLHAKVAGILHRLLGSPALGAQTMYYFKPPGATGQGMHQDNFYLLSKPATCIAAWTAIDDATLDNGCLYLVPGSHKGPILCPDKDAVEVDLWMNYGDGHITRFPRDKKPVPVEVPRGSTMFFSGNLIHGSGPNRTKDRSRRTFIGHYIDQMSEQVSKFYHPVLNMQGEVVSNVVEAAFSGGPCGDGWQGGAH
jgi:ectoine hydroxylase-related dioxygenase (phytanoyl-CoA dioxygenase family)